MSDKTLDDKLNHVLWDNLDLEPGSTDARPMKVKLAADLKSLIESELAAERAAAEARGKVEGLEIARDCRPSAIELTDESTPFERDLHLGWNFYRVKMDENIDREIAKLSPTQGSSSQ